MFVLHTSTLTNRYRSKPKKVMRSFCVSPNSSFRIHKFLHPSLPGFHQDVWRTYQSLKQILIVKRNDFEFSPIQYLVIRTAVSWWEGWVSSRTFCASCHKQKLRRVVAALKLIAGPSYIWFGRTKTITVNTDSFVIIL